LLLGNAVNRDQYIGFGIISGGIAFGDVVGYNDKQPGYTFNPIIIIVQINLSPCLKPAFGNIFFVHQYHPALVVDCPGSDRQDHKWWY
jgi:hypothetical protein